MDIECPLCNAPVELVRNVEQENELSACAKCLNPFYLSARQSRIEAQPLTKVSDVRISAPPDSLGGRLLGYLQDSLEKLPVLPAVSQRVLALTNDPESAIADLADLINEDAVIAAKVLQIANSALYGGLSEISDIKNACARLGMRTVANSVQLVATGNLYQSKEPRYKEMMEKLWAHSVAAAYLAGEIAYMVSEPRVDLLYLCGLTHDIGKVAFIDIISNKRLKKLDPLREKPELFLEVMSRFHTLAGLHVMLHWNLPTEYASAAYWHKDPDQTDNDAAKQIGHIVSLANAIAHQSGFPSEYQQDIPLLTHPSTGFFSLSDIKIAMLRVDLEEKMEVMLGVSA